MMLCGISGQGERCAPERRRCPATDSRLWAVACCTGAAVRTGNWGDEVQVRSTAGHGQGSSGGARGGTAGCGRAAAAFAPWHYGAPARCTLRPALGQAGNAGAVGRTAGRQKAGKSPTRRMRPARWARRSVRARRWRMAWAAARHAAAWRSAPCGARLHAAGMPASAGARPPPAACPRRFAFVCQSGPPPSCR